MTLDVLVFGPAAQAVSADRVRVRLGPAPTATDVLRAIGEQHRELSFALADARLAVNHAFAGADAPVGEGDELALISLVGGG